MTKISISREHGIGYLPILIMQDQKLVEKHAAQLGIKDLTINWPVLKAEDVVYALSQNDVQVASGGIGAFLFAWSISEVTINCKAIAALSTIPLYLNVRNPKITKLQDFKDNGKIALPSMTSSQSMLLQLAVSKIYGDDKKFLLNDVMLPMPHPKAMESLLEKRDDVVAHFASPPYQYTELEHKNVRRLTDSYSIMGGPLVFTLVWTTPKFAQQNPLLYRAIKEALADADAMINRDRIWAAGRYIEITKEKIAPDVLKSMMSDPKMNFGPKASNIMEFANFAYNIKLIFRKPENPSDLFFDPTLVKAN